MINHNHIQLIMNIIKIRNNKRIQQEKSFLTKEELRAIESKYIKFANFINKIEHHIVNNKFSNWLKEQSQRNMNYPLYIVSTEEQIDEEGNIHFKEVYVSKVERGIQEDGKEYVELRMAYEPKYGMDFRKIKKSDRNKTLKELHKRFDDKAFRYKSILTVEAKMETDVTVST